MVTSLESRLRALELQLLSSTSSTSSAPPQTTTTDVTARVQTLERSLQLPSQTQQLWKEVESMEQDLSPGTALTHQKQIMAPMLYRRQQVLAEQDAFRGDLAQVARILHLLLIDQQDNRSKIISEEQVVHAPIVTDAGPTAPEEEKLDALSKQVVDLQSRVQTAAQRLDRLLENYAGLVSAASEKMVLLEEDVRRREKERMSA